MRHKRYQRILNLEVMAVRDIKLRSRLSKTMFYLLVFLAIEDVAVFGKVLVEMFICFILFLFTPFFDLKSTFLSLYVA